jgi:hypothetical protein
MRPFLGKVAVNMFPWQHAEITVEDAAFSMLSVLMLYNEATWMGQSVS